MEVNGKEMIVLSDIELKNLMEDEYSRGYKNGVNPHCDMLEIQHNKCIDVRNKAQMKNDELTVRVKELKNLAAKRLLSNIEAEIEISELKETNKRLEGYIECIMNGGR